MSLPTRRFFLMTVLLSFAVAPALRAAELQLTFFGWSDQHVQTDGNAGHLLPAIDAMNRLPGTPFPPSIGGTVSKPAFVLGCGDITEWPTRAARDTYDELITRRLKFPVFDVAGNHDTGGKVRSRTILDWIEKRHGALSYRFERGGVHFIVVFSELDETLNSPAQPLTQQALQFIRNELDRIPDGEPVIVVTHLCFDALTNRDELIDALGEANVLMILGGHYHKAKVDRYRGISFVQLPSPRPGSASHVTVIQLTPDRLLAIPYDYEANKWSDAPRTILNQNVGGS